MRTIITPKPTWFAKACEECKAKAEYARRDCFRGVLARFVQTATVDAIVNLLTDLNERSDDLELEARRWGGSQG